MTIGGTVTLPDWVRADEAKPAPQPLLLVQAFVNTWEGDTDIDQLASAETGIPWLRAAGLIDQDPVSVTPVLPSPAAPAPAAPAASAPAASAAAVDVALRHAREVRESLRAMLAHNGGEPPPTDVELAPLAALARASRPQLSVDSAGQIELTGGPAGGL